MHGAFGAGFRGNMDPFSKGEPEDRLIYFDNNATTLLLPEVLAEMRPYFEEEYGNPSSVHQVGSRCRAAVERARTEVARLIGAMASEIIFTGTGSEANNLALLGSAGRGETQSKNLVVSGMEHASVREAALWAERTLGMEARFAPCRIEGDRIDPKPFCERIDENTVVVSVVFANSETGVLLPVREIFAEARARGALTHTDATQAVGKVPIHVRDIGCDMLTLAGHKFHGPKGIGVLYKRRGVKVQPLIHGGPHEHSLRAGTENVPYIMGLAAAARLAAEAPEMQIRDVRDYFESQLKTIWGDRAMINFQHVARTPNTSSVRFPGQDANLLLIKLDRAGVCSSTGSACSSGSLSASPTLLALGLTEQEAKSTLRFSFSRLNTRAEVDRALAALKKILPV